MNKLLQHLLFTLLIAFSVTGCQQASESGAPASNDAGGGGQGGSMARFAVSGDNLYAVTKHELMVFNANDPAKPFEVGTLDVGWGIETIFPYKDHLFIGSETGMFIYDNTNPNRPKLKGQFTHARACDPVVVQDTFAYVTLRGGTRCGGFTNQLDVLSISDIMHPQLLRSYPMTSPYGLGIDGNRLFVCDGDDGLKVYDSEDPADMMRIAHYRDLNAYDVIPRDGVLMMIGEDGLYQYDYNVQGRPKLLSTIEVKRKSKR